MNTSSRTLFLLSSWFVVACALTLFASAYPPSPALEAEIDRILEQTQNRPAFWGLYVEELSTGEALYSHNADHLFVPASNEKVFTTATALDALGRDYRYQTKLLFDGTVDDTELKGDLILEGSGDPAFGSSEIRRGDPLQQWAQRLADMGVTRVEGRLIGDDDVFDNKSYNEGWDVDYMTSQASRLLGVSVGGLSYRDNLVRVRIRSSQPGQAPTVTTHPSDYLDIQNHATTAPRRRGRAIEVNRAFGEEAIQISGSVPSGYAGTIFVPVTDPTHFTLYNFKETLEEAGIDAEELELVDIDELRPKPEFEGAQPLFVHLSPPLSELLSVINKESNNFYADQVFRSFGYAGSAEGGENRVKALLRRAGADADAVSIRDGSGLSRKNLMTPKAMVKLLAHMREHSEQEVFLRSLPEGGEAESTLRFRLQEVPVRAKTGSIELVRTLSGYTTTAEGQEVAFAFFANNYAAPSYLIVQTFDRIVRAINASNLG